MPIATPSQSDRWKAACRTKAQQYGVADDSLDAYLCQYPAKDVAEMPERFWRFLYRYPPILDVDWRDGPGAQPRPNPTPSHGPWGSHEWFNAIYAANTAEEITEIRLRDPLLWHLDYFRTEEAWQEHLAALRAQSEKDIARKHAHQKLFGTFVVDEVSDTTN